MNLTITQFDLHDDGLLSADISELNNRVRSANFEVIRIDGERFVLSKVDRDASHEDIMGWRFVNPETGVKVLIVND